MFDESKHPRADDGKFTDGTGKTYRQNTDYNDILEDAKHEESESISDSEPQNRSEEVVQPNLEEILGQEFKGYKGQAAVDKLMQEKQGHIKGAFHRDDIGDIDLLWGNDYLGLQHIIAHRDAQGINAEEFLSDLAEVVEKGRFKKKNSRGNFEFIHDRKMVIIAPEYNGNKITYVLTAYKTRAQK